MGKMILRRILLQTKKMTHKLTTPRTALIVNQEMVMLVQTVNVGESGLPSRRLSHPLLQNQCTHQSRPRTSLSKLFREVMHHRYQRSGQNLKLSSLYHVPTNHTHTLFVLLVCVSIAIMSLP